MSDLKLFKLAANQVVELSVSSMALEKSLQTLIDKHLDIFLGITFLDPEHSTCPANPNLPADRSSQCCVQATRSELK